MKRRTLIKAIGLGGLGLGMRSSYGLQLGNIKFSAKMNGVDLPSTPIPFNSFPRVINIFLYGGPSELAGNLTNIEDINTRSLNKYTNSLLQPTSTNGGQITPNGFWKNAGGDAMEAMLRSGVMTIYRTMSRTRDHDLKAHRESVLQNQLGSFDMDRSGIGTTLSELILAHKENGTFDKPLENILLPFVSFDSQAQWFIPGDVQIESVLRPTSLGRDLGANNPYTRNSISNSNIDGALENLAKSINLNSGKAATPIRNAFAAREGIASTISRFSAQGITDHLNSLGAGAALTYSGNGFGPALKSAVSLMLMNPDTLYAAVGGGAMGGWDDHNGALANGDTDYIARAKNLMDAIMVAMVHIRAAKNSGNAAFAHADSIMINVYGDFGRNVDLNNSGGWDHGNNQNLYTFGGREFRANALGKVVGTTDLLLTNNGSRMFTKPKSDSYQFEPFSLASSLYKYYGVANPAALNGGVPAIDDNQASATIQNWTPDAGSIYATVGDFFAANP